MKKLLMLAVFIFLCGSANSQWLAYNYKASIKRLDNQIGNYSYSPNVFDGKEKASGIFDSYAVASDSLTGYLLVPICEGCSEYGDGSSLSFGESYLYVLRKGDKTKSVWKFSAVVNMGLFNKSIFSRPMDDDLEFYPSGLKKLSQSWAEILFDFEDAGLMQSYGKYGEFQYGFLGYGSVLGSVSSTGFGKAILISETSQSICDPAITNFCLMVDSVSGSLVGNVIQTGACGVPPIWNVCSLEQTELGIVYGSWSIKFNQKISESVNNEDTDAVLLKAIGGSEIIY